MNFLRLRLGRKIGGGCIGIGRDPMLVRLTRRQEVMQLRIKKLPLGYHGCKIKMKILSNVDEYNNTLLEFLSGSLSPKLHIYNCE